MGLGFTLSEKQAFSCTYQGLFNPTWFKQMYGTRKSTDIWTDSMVASLFGFLQIMEASSA